MNLITKLRAVPEETQREILIFLIKLTSIYLFWRLFSFFIGYEAKPIEDRLWPWLSIQWENLNDLFRIGLLKSGRWFLDVLGYDSLIYGKYILYIKGYPGVGVGNYCIGFQLMVLYTALIISTAIPLKVKLVAIPFGLLVIQILNVLRIVGIALVLIYFPDYVFMSHDYIFNLIVLGVIIFMYYKILSYK